MSKNARDTRVIERGWANVDTIIARSRKDNRRFERWYSGLQVQPTPGYKGMMMWARLPTGRALIHKGRKP
jgi:hypothetical protein